MRSRSPPCSSRDASSNVHMVAGAAEELSASIGEIGKQLDRAKTLAERALGEAEATNAEIGSLSEAARRSGTSSTSSARLRTRRTPRPQRHHRGRPGGRRRQGFAVVASEVKTLAAQTAKAPRRSRSRSSPSRPQRMAPSGAIRGKFTGRMREINETTVGIAASTIQQGSATEEISRNVPGRPQHSPHGPGREHGDGASQRTAETAFSVNEAVRTVDDVVLRLEQEIERFLIRCA